MIKGFKRLVLAGTLAALALAAASPTLADDLAERRRLVAELLQVAPYSDEQARQEFAQELPEALRRGFKTLYTDYADREARVVIEQLVSEMPSMNAWITDLLVKGLTVDELEQALGFIRSPLAVKLRAVEPTLTAAKTDEEKLAIIEANFTPAELQQMADLQKQPAFAKYNAVISGAAQPFGEKLSEDLFERLQARCPKRTAPLPWCD